jgi:hypothetical protein
LLPPQSIRSQIDDLTFTRDNCSGARVIRLSRERIHKVVVV